MKNHLLFSFFLLISVNLYAQGPEKFEPGYLVKINGDTIKGFISFTQPIRKDILFKSRSENTNYEKFEPLQIKALFTQYDHFFYYPLVLDIDQKPVSRSNTDLDIDDSAPKYVRDTILLRQVTQGKVSLYRYEDIKKVHFFFRKDEGEIKELLYIEYLQRERAAVAELPIYKQQLQTELSGCKLNFTQLTYTERSLKNVVEDYNRCNGSMPVDVKGEKKIKTNFYVIGGMSLNLSNAYTSEYLNSPFYPPIMVQPTAMPYIVKAQPLFGLGMDLESKRPNHRYGFGGELLWRKISAEGTSNYSADPNNIPAYTHITFDFTFIQLNLLARRYFKTKGKLSPYLNGGVSVNYFTNSASRYIYNGSNFSTPFSHDFPINNFNTIAIGAQLGLGANYGRLIFSVKGEIFLANANESYDSQFKAINLNMMVGYHLKK